MSPFGFLVLIVVLTCCYGGLRQCAYDQTNRRAASCYEKTKDISCFGISEKKGL